MRQRRARRVDAACAATCWQQALGWIAARPEPIREIQYWGHGHWGEARIGDDVLDASALVYGNLLHTAREALRERLAPDPLVRFRTCETLGARRGIDFAERLADFLAASENLRARGAANHHLPREPDPDGLVHGAIRCDALRARMRHQSRHLLGFAIVALFMTGCEKGRPPTAVAPCAKVGDQCKLPDGPLGCAT